MSDVLKPKIPINEKTYPLIASVIDLDKIQEVLNNLYKDIPEVVCEEGCGECCGANFPNFVEWLLIYRYCRENNIEIPEKANIDEPCPFLDEKKRCKIYPVRPIECRLFGVVKEMRCPYHPEWATIPPNKVRKILREHSLLNQNIYKTVVETIGDKLMKMLERKEKGGGVGGERRRRRRKD